MNRRSEPILARASAPGRAGVGVVRLSGPLAPMRGIARALFPGRELEPRRAHFRRVRGADGAVLDEAVVLWFPEPHSYTGETVLEIQGHGGSAVLGLVMGRCLEAGREFGLRPARPGEFTERAFLNGRMDLAQAEAVADLIDAESEAGARAAMRSLSGAFSQEVHALAGQLTELRVFVEATLDFPEEDIEFVREAQVRSRIEAVSEQCGALRRRAMRGKVLRDGLHVVLAGAPNAGKSSLLNRLAGEEAAIVTDIAGTTRDRIDRTLRLEGMTLHVTDTAGLRESSDPVERMGVARTLEAVEKADVVLRLVAPDVPDDRGEELAMLLPRLRPGAVFLTAASKCDLGPAGVPVDLSFSARTGEGMEELSARLAEIAGQEAGSEGDFLARARHLECLTRAQDRLSGALAALETSTLDICAEELRLASDELGQITGQVLPDDLLGRIFSSFCIGK